MSDYIEREAVNALIKAECSPKVAAYLIDAVAAIPAADVRPVPAGGIGEMSDGYHTFNGLYYQRMVLFAALVKAYNSKAWKSWKHEDGEPCFGGGWFIVGIDTPQGSYTYHYEAKDFDLFECEELPVAKHWDGHTEKDVTRLMSLDMRPVEWIPVTERRAEIPCICCDANGNLPFIPQGLLTITDAQGTWQIDAHLADPHLHQGKVRPVLGYGNRITHWMQLPEPPKEET